MKNEILRQKRINQQLADLPFSSRSPRIRQKQQASEDNIFNVNKISKKKLRNNFYGGGTSERYYNSPPFSLNCKKYEDDYATIEAHARFCKAKIPGQDIDEFEKMSFYIKVKSDNYVSHYNNYFDQEEDLNRDFIINSNNKSSKSIKASSNLKKMKGSYPSFCKPFNERIKELIDKEVNNNQKYSNQPNLYNNGLKTINLNSFDPDNEYEKSIKNKDTSDANSVNIIKKKANTKKAKYTPNIHVTRRVKSYYIANNMDLPDFLEHIDPIPLRYDRVIHYEPSVD